MIKTHAFNRMMITVVLAVFLLLTAFSYNYLAFASDTDKVENDKLLEYTRGMVYYSDGSILIVSRYNFSDTYSHTFNVTVNGENKQITLSYKELVPLILSLAKAAKLQISYDVNTPNIIDVVEKKYNNLTEMYHDMGITGNEISPSPKVETFWKTTYISDITSYLADGGKENLTKNWLTYAKTIYGIQEIDLSIVTFNYCYGNKYSNIKSNADEVVENKKDGMYYHVFKNINEESKMSLYQTVANTKNWLLVLTLSSVGVAVIGVIILIVIKKKQKN